MFKLFQKKMNELSYGYSRANPLDATVNFFYTVSDREREKAQTG